MITISETINAGPDTVWNAWTEPGHIIRWNFATEEWHCPSASNNLEVGGVYVARMEAKDGSMGFDFEAVYDEIIFQKKLAYTLTDGRKVITTFNDNDGKTQVLTQFEAESQNPVDMQRQGWQAILNNFKRYVES